MKRTKKLNKSKALDNLASEFLKAAGFGVGGQQTAAEKAAVTRATEYDLEALAVIVGDGCYNSDGYALNAAYAFEGGSEDEAGQIVPIAQAEQERTIDTVRQVVNAVHKKGGNKAAQNKAARERRRNKRRNQIAGK